MTSAAAVACHAAGLSPGGARRSGRRAAQAQGQKIWAQLTRSLDLALADDAHEHAARAYTNLGSTRVRQRSFPEADRLLKAGIDYCTDRDLDTWRLYMRAWLAYSLAEQGRYAAAEQHLADVARRPAAIPCDGRQPACANVSGKDKRWRCSWTRTPSAGRSPSTTWRRRTPSDLQAQDAYGVHYLRYWVDQQHGKIFCLVDAPDADAAATVHREAHGLVADEISPVTEGA